MKVSRHSRLPRASMGLPRTLHAKSRTSASFSPCICTSERREGGTPPGILYEYRDKGIAKFDCCKCMKRKEQLLSGGAWGEFPISRLAATLMDLPASVANKRLTAWLSPLDATLTKNRGVPPSGQSLSLIDRSFVRSLPRYLFTSLLRVPLLACGWRASGRRRRW